jgi:hypothetical protein
MRTNGYTWLGVNDVQALLRKVKQGFEINKGKASDQQS